MRVLPPWIPALAALALVAGVAAAERHPPKALRAAAKAAGTVNGLCPVLKQPVEKAGGSVTFRGERIGFCRPACRTKFEADPTRYMDRMRLNPAKYAYTSKHPTLADMRAAKRAVKAANGRCPVMGRLVTKEGGHATYKGQVIAFCCPGCVERFGKQPERYLRPMRADPLAYAYDRPGPTNAEMRIAREQLGTANGRCPVMGRLVVAGGGEVTYKGQRIGFCCPGCIAKFRRAPEKYMAILRDEPEAYGYVPPSR